MQVELGIISHKPQDNELLERCIQSLIRVPAGISYNLILQFGPGSYAENWNRLMARVNADFVCVLEDDTAALRPMWLRSLVSTMAQYRDAAIVMPIETKDGRYADPGFKSWLDKTVQIPATYGFCNLIRKEAGLVADENLTYFTDVDLSYQAYDKGWTCLCNGHVWLLHGADEGRMTSPDRKEELDEIQRPDREYLAQKWERKGEAA